MSTRSVGFDAAELLAGRVSAYMRLRAEAIEGELTLRSRSRRGTSIEVVLRPAWTAVQTPFDLDSPCTIVS